MPQAVIIQQESILPVSAKKAALTKETGEVEAFSVQLDKQVKQNEAATKPSQTESVVAAKPAEQDEELAADGNNLPEEAVSDTETIAESDETTTKELDSTESKAEVIHPEVGTEGDVALPETGDETDDILDVAAESETVENVTEQDLADDNVPRAHVSVSQHAVDNAKTTRVEMTAKPHPQQSVNTEAKTQSDVDKPVVETLVADGEKLKPKPDITPVVNVATKSNLEMQASDKKATPNLAMALKQLDTEEAKVPKIRADILDALQRQQSKQEVSTNLRDVIFNQNVKAAETDSAALLSKLPQHASADKSGILSTAMTSASAVTLPSQAATQSAGLSPNVISLPVQPTLQNAAWNQVMSSRVVWMAKEGVQQAQLRMNPANLGPVEVRLHIQNDQASVTFLAQHSATRDALEQALPRLRESFAENGMELANAHVGQQAQQQHEQAEHASESQYFTQASGQDDDIEIDNEAVETVSSETSVTGLSLYA